MKLLVVSPYLPYPLDSGGNTRVFNLLNQLGRHGVEIVLAVVTAERLAPETLDAFAKLLPHVRTVQLSYLGERWRKAAHFLLSQLGLGGACWGPTHRLVNDLIEREGVDLVQVEYSQAARYLPATSVPAILVYLEFRSRIVAREESRKAGPWERLQHGLKRRLFEHEEFLHVPRYDAIVCMSDEDRRYLLSRRPAARVEVIENGVDTASIGFEPPARVRGAYLLGWFMNEQNNIALDYFLDGIWPRLQGSGTDVVVIGKDLAHVRAARLERAGIHCLGFLDHDAFRVATRGRILVVPLLTGSGTRLKILEAFAAGNPVVSTAVGIEGIATEPGRHFLKAETPDEFAEAIRRLQSDPALAARLAQAARELAVSRYDWSRISDAAVPLYQTLASRPRILTNMAFWQSVAWAQRTTSLYLSPGDAKPRPPFSLLREAFELWRRAPRFGVVMTMGARESLAYGLLCLLTRRPSKQIMTEVFIDEPCLANPLWRIKVALYHAVAQRAIGILTNSAAEVGTIARRFGIARDQLRYLPMHTNILDPEFCETNDGFILAAGYTRRDYATLLAAAPAIKALIVIMCSRHERMSPDLPANVTVFREVRREDYLDRLKRCAVAVIPLLPTERSTGQVVLLEAMALGKPVVATRAPGIVDHVRDAENGLLVEPADVEGLATAVNRLLTDCSLAERLARNALADVLRDNTIDLHARNRLLLIDELWQSRPISP